MCSGPDKWYSLIYVKGQSLCLLTRLIADNSKCCFSGEIWTKLKESINRKIWIFKCFRCGRTPGLVKPVGRKVVVGVYLVYVGWGGHLLDRVRRASLCTDCRFLCLHRLTCLGLTHFQKHINHCNCGLDFSHMKMHSSSKVTVIKLCLLKEEFKKGLGVSSGNKIWTDNNLLNHQHIFFTGTNVDGGS